MSALCVASSSSLRCMRTFILSYVLQSEGQACILSLHDPHLAKGALPHHPQKSKMIKVDCVQHTISSSRSHLGGIARLGHDSELWHMVRALHKGRGSPSSVNTTGLPLELPIGDQYWCNARSLCRYIGPPYSDQPLQFSLTKLSSEDLRSLDQVRYWRSMQERRRLDCKS